MNEAKKQFHYITKREIVEREFSRPRVAVDVDIKIDEHAAAVLKRTMSDVALIRYTHRKTAMIVRNFNVRQSAEDHIFNFRVETEVPETFVKVAGDLPADDIQKDNLIATNFPDFCWVHSEGTSQYNAGETQTPHRKDATLGDLTWVLPSKFADDLIETMHCLNLEVLEGVLQDAVLYGPIFIGKSNQS